MKKLEFHVHTKYSKDSILNYYFILMMCKIRKINCIAITDHNEIEGAIKYKNKLKKHNIQVIVGEEIFTKDGEIIGLFLNEKIPAGLGVNETIKKIKEQDGFVYIPHPYDEKRIKTVLRPDALNKILNDIDMIEIHNGRNIEKKYSDFQQQIANKNNLVGVVGSDAHTFYELGRNYCLVESIKKEEFINNMRNATFVIKPCIKFAHCNTKIARIIQIFVRGNFNELYRIINKKCKRTM